MRLASPCHLSLIMLSACGMALPCQAAEPDAKGVEFFEKQVRPVLVSRCFECHSASKKIKGGLALDSRDNILKGGDSGPVITAGDPAKSKLIEAVRYQNQDLRMPPKSPLPASELKALEEWVRMGAPDPRTEEAPQLAAKKPRIIDVSEGRKFWSFQPLSAPAVPQVKSAAWVRTPIDAFILAKLEQNGLSPSAPADKRTLIRRATHDLTGLPPTPHEVAAFLKDESPDAFDKVIERLLASPRYGERWGRHWLDVARYADSNGLDENIALGHAWRYRDYVVKSFNDDKPFDQFLIEQVAGDLLGAKDEATRLDQLAATGFLSLGAKVLAEPDMQKLVMDIIDEQLDTTGKAFMGMTLGCVRCHDHKFDPIRQDDYYALAAIFRSTKSLGDERTGAIKFWYEHSLATAEQIEAKKTYEKMAKDKMAELAAFTNKARSALKAELQANAANYLATAASLSMQADFSEIVKLASGAKLRPRYLLTCRQYLERNKEHPVFAKWHELASKGETELIRAHYAKLFADAAAAQKAAQAAAEKSPPPAAPSAPAKKGKAASPAKAIAKPADPALAAAHDALTDIAGFLAIPDKDADAFDADTVAKIEQMKAEHMSYEDKTPEPPAIMGVAEGAISKTLPIHIRGSYLMLGKEIPRGFPEVMAASLAKPVLPAKQSGRLELARWMASGEHPLTARVFVNRLWRWHFGKGIVASTDNFGLLGDKPSHPELLDWLARSFIENGWAIKDMHRLIMRSAAYQQSSGSPESGVRSSELLASSEKANAKTVIVNQQGTFEVEAPAPHSALRTPDLLDPENRLLWRFHIQRLEAEQVRDSLLFVSGGLSEQIGGKTIPQRNKEFVFNHTSKDHTTYETPRRALYLPIIRNHLYDMLEQFDYPDPTMPTGSRSSTTVAPQALILMNSPVASDAAARLAATLHREASTVEARLQAAYRLLYSREPDHHEIARNTTFLHSLPDQVEAWKLLCQALLAANEFVFLR